MRRFKLEQLLVKTTFFCNCSCDNCLYRKELYKKNKGKRVLTLNQWKTILQQARQLGARSLVLSGGEPTLYPDLDKLIRIGKNNGWRVKVNSNGSMIHQDYARKLLDAGLDSMTISLYSPDPDINDTMRKSKGLWAKSTEAIKILSNLQKEYPSFHVSTQSILCRQNFESFPELLELHYRLGSNRLTISYLEGNFEKNDLLTMEMIYTFKETIIPRAIDFCQMLEKDVREVAIRELKNIFSFARISPDEWAAGIYQPKRLTMNKPCCITREQALILPNGDVLPCNFVEYLHEPIMGNVFHQSLSEIWNSRLWNDFREKQLSECELCPMNLHFSIPLRFDKKMKLRNFYERKVAGSQFYPILKPLVNAYKGSRFFK